LTLDGGELDMVSTRRISSLRRKPNPNHPIVRPLSQSLNREQYITVHVY